MKLSPEERARLADRLIASLSDDAEIEEAWALEVERRIAEIEAGRAPELRPPKRSHAPVKQ